MFRPFTTTLARLAAISGLLIAVGGCGDEGTAPAPGPSGDGQETFDVGFDGQEVVLQRTTTDPGAGPEARVDLVATEFSFDASTGVVRLDVALRNASGQDLYAPARVFLGRFRPEGTRVLNGDEQLIDPLPGTTWPLPHLFDYSAQLGGDGVLGAREQSAPRTWEIQTVEGRPFSFAVVVRFGVDPTRPTLGGRVFSDTDRDGEPDPDEGPGLGMAVQVTHPDGRTDMAPVAPDGRWRVPVESAGMYRALLILPPTMSFAPVCFTTPNPLYVMLPPTAAGTVTGYDRAHFGIDPEPCRGDGPMPIGLHPGPLDSLKSDGFQWMEAELIGPRVLRLAVGFSGCGPDHPFALVASTAFRESLPPATEARLLHDARGELCAAHFRRDLHFDLTPLVRAYRSMYGDAGPFVLWIRDPATGQAHRFLID